MIHLGDCLTVMRTMPSESVDAIVTDPPAAVSFMNKSWDSNKGGRTQWVAWMTEVMVECHRLLKPGGYAVVWSLPRTCHWTAWAMEDAGFIIRDQLAHIFASGFPKGKAQLKPAREDWWLARKPGPLRPLNIEENRIATTEDLNGGTYSGKRRSHPGAWQADDRSGGQGSGFRNGVGEFVQPAGRWPSNLLLSDPELFDEPNPWVVGSGATVDGATSFSRAKGKGIFDPGDQPLQAGYGDSGGYSRFFVIPKAPSHERYVLLRCDCETAKLESWENVDPKLLAQTDITSPGVGTFEATSTADSGLPMMSSGSSTSEPSRKGSRSTTSTATSSTTESKTSSPSIASSTSGSTPAASSLMASGGSDAPSAPSTASSPPNGGTSPERVGRSTAAAVRVTSRKSSKRSVCDVCGAAYRPEGHPTQKPLDLMRHLIRLVTPIGGTILDPFLGSGTTIVAAELEGFPWVAIEQDPSYVAIAEARLNGTQRGLGLDVAAPTQRRATKPLEQRSSKEQARLRKSNAERPIEDLYWTMKGRKDGEEPAA